MTPAKMRIPIELSPYYIPYILLRADLSLLEELNKELPKSIDAITHRRRKEVEMKAESLACRLDEKSKAEWRTLMLALEGRSEQSDEFRQSGEDMSLDSILNNKDALRILLQKFQTDGFSYNSNKFIRNMSLIYLVAKFEIFLRRILKITFQSIPEILMTSQKSVSYEELLKLEKYDDIKEHIFEKEIQYITNQDVTDIDRYMKQKLNLRLSEYANWRKFKERFYRRNILVHNEGLPNRLYRTKTGYQGKDAQMDISSQYLQVSISMFHDMSLWIVRNLNKKFNQGYSERALL
ncbi:MAG: hypothetical protein ABSB28_06730 [Candidatus Bathyarchaeia archaeon]